MALTDLDRLLIKTLRRVGMKQNGILTVFAFLQTQEQRLELGLWMADRDFMVTPSEAMLKMREIHIS